MGSDAKPVEQPVIQVTLPSFWIGKCLVTFDEFDYFCTETGREKPADQEDEREGYAVRTVSWLDAEAYVRWLSETLDQPIRLPSEAEWEFAARGGNLTKGFRYAGSDNLEEVGWFGENSGIQWPRVGQLKPNELGIFDMSGNVWEWVQDAYASCYDASHCKAARMSRVLRGASWDFDYPRFARAAARGGDPRRPRRDRRDPGRPWPPRAAAAGSARPAGRS